MQILYSKPIVEQLQLATSEKVASLIDEGYDPQLAVVLVGDDPQSLRYIEKKSEASKACGIILCLYHHETITQFAEVQQTLHYLSQDPEIHGIILQLPLPAHFTSDEVDQLIHSIAPLKDVDGLRGEWQKADLPQPQLNELLEPRIVALPPMISAVISLLDFYKIDLKNKRIVVVGAGRLVGRPLHAYLSALGFSVSVVDEDTPQILGITREADILITGTGQSDLITYQWIKEGAVVIDCARDIHMNSVSQVASALSPATGGIGPLTVAWLLYNTAQAVQKGGKNE